jgi:CelD/BcsL family acetyltransferase involved in cellulose biosynthesis
MRGSVRADLITDSSQLAALEPEWRELWKRTARTTPFQSPMWLLPWWRVFGSDELCTVAMRDEGRLAALAPLYVLRDEDESLGMPLGSGNSDYVDLLASTEVLPQILETLTTLDCAMWDFPQIPSGSPLLDVATPKGWTDSVTDHEPCPVLSIEGAGDDLENLISTHFRKKLRYYRRSLEHLGSVSVQSADASNLDTLIDALFELHTVRWERKGLPGMLRDETDRRFQREAAHAMFDAGALRMYATRAGQRIVAVFYGFAHAGTVYYYLSGYDPELERLSIGTVVVAHAIEQAVRDGAQWFDFLRGAEQYKYAWGAKDRINKRRQLFRG